MNALWTGVCRGLMVALGLACTWGWAAEVDGVRGRAAEYLLARNGLFTDFPVLTNPVGARSRLGNLVEPRLLTNAAGGLPAGAAERVVAASPRRAYQPGSRSMETLDDKQKLGVGDKLSFRVLEDQEESKTLTVTDAGELDVPELGLVPVAGKTCRQLAFELKPKLEQTAYYQATVIMGIEVLNKTMSGRRVYVAGSVQRTGPQELPGGETWTVSKAIMRAGGFTVYAAKDKVRLVRTGSPTKTFIVDVNKVWEKGRTELDLALEAEDLIYVPTRVITIY